MRQVVDSTVYYMYKCYGFYSIGPGHNLITTCFSSFFVYLTVFQLRFFHQDTMGSLTVQYSLLCVQPLQFFLDMERPQSHYYIFFHRSSFISICFSMSFFTRAQMGTGQYSPRAFIPGELKSSQFASLPNASPTLSLKKKNLATDLQQRIQTAECAVCTCVRWY